MVVQQIIKQERQNQGISLRKLSEMTGISANTLCKWESGGGEPLISNADKVCKALGISITIGAEEPALQEEQG